MLPVNTPRKRKSASPTRRCRPADERRAMVLDAEERQRAISQQLLSRTLCSSGWCARACGRASRVQADRRGAPSKVEDHIVVPKPIGLLGAGREGNPRVFRLGYVDARPETAQRIANRLATVFVEEDSRPRRSRRRTPQKCSLVSSRRARIALVKLQEQLRLREQANLGQAVPDQMNANVSMVNGAPAARLSVAAVAHRAGPALDAESQIESDETGRRRRDGQSGQQAIQV